MNTLYVAVVCNKDKMFERTLNNVPAIKQNSLQYISSTHYRNAPILN